MTRPDDELPAAGTPSNTNDSDDEAPQDPSTDGVAIGEADLFAPDDGAPVTARVEGEAVTSAGWPPSPAGANGDGGGFEQALGEDGDEAAMMRPKRHRVRRVVWELTQTLVLAALIFLLVRAVAQNFRVEGPSMEPGLHNGQYLLVNKAVYFKLNLGTLSKYIPFIDGENGEETFLFHGPQRGDVIVFRYPKDPDRDFIKRVIGVPGDTVRIDDAGTVFVNGEPIEEGYISDTAPRALEEQIVPPESYFVLGDNRPNSSDSRNWGFVPEENIIGKAMLSYWPLSELGGVGNHSLDLGFVEVPLP